MELLKPYMLLCALEKNFKLNTDSQNNPILHVIIPSDSRLSRTLTQCAVQCTDYTQ
jgi:hypothetical protein